ncbi:MAG: DUF1573 domain-containing protein [Planctomycetota bacterium]|nr:DUF1573 domain-containing protein [Planctomycetota bacterium]
MTLMRTSLFIFWSLVFAGDISPLFASPVSLLQTQQQTTPPAPVSIEPPVVDFGKVKPGSKLPAKFLIRNRGTQPLTIKSVVPSCKCTDVNELAGKVIAPGASVELLATLDVPGTPGEKDAKVFVTFDGYGAPQMVMMKADASLPIRVTPAYIDALKAVVEGKIVVASDDGKPFTILSAGGVAPKFLGFDPTKDAPKSSYTLRWTLPNTSCETMPLWWVVETDRVDCPLIAMRIRHECTGSKADPTKAERYWFFPEPLAVAGRLAIGESAVVSMIIEHYNPKERGKVIRPEWSQVKSVRSLSPQMTATLDGLRPGNKDDVAVLIRVAPVAGVTGILYAPVEIETATGKGVFAVSMQAVAKSDAGNK